MANAPIVVAEGEEELEVDYDSDGYPILPERSKVRYDSLYFDDVLTWSFQHVQVIDPLPPIDHSAVSLEPQLCFLESLLCSVIPLPSLFPPPLPPSPSSPFLSLPLLPSFPSLHSTTLHVCTHSQIDYPSFERNFYEQHSEISVLSPAEVRDLRKKMGLRVNQQYV